MPGRRRRSSTKTPTVRSKAELGEVRNGRLHLPDHPLALKGGWVSERRALAFQSRNGVCVCDAGQSSMEWADAKVVDVGSGDPLVLCQSHAGLRWFAAHIAATGFGGAVGERLTVELGALWAAACPAGGSSVPEERQGHRETPFGGSPGVRPSPDSQEAMST